MSPSFYVTFDTHEATWTGHLTVRASIAIIGPPRIAATHICSIRILARHLEDAIAALKTRIERLLATLCWFQHSRLRFANKVWRGKFAAAYALFGFTNRRQL